MIKSIDSIEFKKTSFLIGDNGSGKTYILNKIEEMNEDALYIEPNGKIDEKNRFGKVRIVVNKYLFENEAMRGKRNETIEADNLETISNSSMKIIEACRKRIYNIEKIVNRSKGQIKYYHFYRNFLKINLNNIKYFLLDEPECNYDEKLLKDLAEFIKILKDNGKIVIIATHSSRLLELYSADIDDIYLKTHDRNDELINVTLDDCKKIMNDIYLQYKEKELKRSVAFLKLSENELFTAYSNVYMKSYLFYAALFSNKIYLVEGFSEKIAYGYLSTKNINGSLYMAGGKDFLIFYALLFKMFNKECIVIYDTDLQPNDNNSNSINAKLNALIEKGKENNSYLTVPISPDFERKFNFMEKSEFFKQFDYDDTELGYAGKMYKQLVVGNLSEDKIIEISEEMFKY